MAFPAAPTAPVYRKTKSGDFVIFGPESLITVGPVTVTLKSGATQKTHILSVGAVFDVEGTPCRYGYQTVAVNKVAETVAALGAASSNSPSSVEVNLDADSFQPDTDQFSGAEYNEPSNTDTDQFTGEYDMPPNPEAFILPPFDPDNPYA